MAIQIGKDGAIINGDQVISDSGTIIREDGTIESSNIAGSPGAQRNYVSHDAPVSPFERGGNRQSQISESPQVLGAQPDSTVSVSAAKSIADLEYDLMVAEGHVRGSIPKTPLIALVIMLLLGIAVHPIFIIGTVVAGVMVFIGFSKKCAHEEEVQRLKNEIDALKRRQR